MAIPAPYTETLTAIICRQHWCDGPISWGLLISMLVSDSLQALSSVRQVYWSTGVYMGPAPSPSWLPHLKYFTIICIALQVPSNIPNPSVAPVFSITYVMVMKSRLALSKAMVQFLNGLSSSAWRVCHCFCYPLSITFVFMCFVYDFLCTLQTEKFLDLIMLLKEMLWHATCPYK